MQPTVEENTYMKMRAEGGKVLNNMVFVVAKSGYGKGTTTESMAEEYHKLGYTVLVLHDPKNQAEWAYAMFEPTEHYHLQELRKVGKPVGAKKVKLYHPFTFGIPKHEIPDIQFFTFSLKDLGRDEWSMLAETDYDTDTIKLLMNASRNISKQDGLYGFLHYLQDYARGKTEGKRMKPDPKNFYLSVAGGTAKSIQDIANYLQPFSHDYFLSPDSSELKLDWKEILNDQEHYHVFLTNWLAPGDRKLKEFCVMALFSQIIRNEKFARKPLLIVLPEVRYLIPYNPKGYKLFLGRVIKDHLSTMRSIGRGMSALLDTQVFSDVDESIMNSATITFLGELGGARDVEKIGKALKYKRETQQRLVSMGAGKTFMTYMMVGKEDHDTFRFWMPGHRHAEPEYNFFEHYKRERRDDMKVYTDLIKQMESELADEEERFRERAKRREKEERERAEKIRKEREARKSGSDKVEAKLEKAKAIEQKGKAELMRLVYEFRQQNPDMSWRDLGRQFKLDHKTAKKYAEGHAAGLAGAGAADDDAGDAAEEESDDAGADGYEEDVLDELEDAAGESGREN